MSYQTMRELAKVIRSKNSGPFDITFDVIFDNQRTYQLVKDSGSVTPDVICALYEVTPDDIVTFMFFDPALAFKLTLRRGWEQGTTGERDTFGAQQHAPLLDIRVEIP